MQITNLHATITSTRTKAIARFKVMCDQQGQGRACYDYGRAMWSQGPAQRLNAKKYLRRGCELKYKPACEDYDAHSSTVHHSNRHYRTPVTTDGPVGPCFVPKDLERAKFYPNMISATGVHGQLIGNIAADSFWTHVGFLEADVIVRVNNQPFNSEKEAVQAFASAGKKFSFEILRNREVETLWYTCR